LRDLAQSVRELTESQRRYEEKSDERFILPVVLRETIRSDVRVQAESLGAGSVLLPQE